MDIKEAKGMLEFEKVKYISNPTKDVSAGEIGYVSSVNDTFIFIKFENRLNDLGWDAIAGQACNFNQVVALKGYYDGWIVSPNGRTLGHSSFGEAMAKGTFPDQQNRLDQIGIGHFLDILTQQRTKGLR